MTRIATLALGVAGIVVMVMATRQGVAPVDGDTAGRAAAGVSAAGAARTAASGGGVTFVPAPPPAIRAEVPAALAAAPPRARTPADLPATLELVTIVAPPGSSVPEAKPISRADALASVIGSPQFQDTVSPLARLYFAAFGRFPDYPGLNHYTGAREDGALLAQIADEFARGREFEQRYGKLDNAEFVERVFVNVLGHPSQADVRGYWIEELDSGRMTRGAVLVDLSESGAFRERTANQVFVSTAYTEILRRTPDAAGYAHWVALLDSGYPPRTVIDGLLGGR